MTLPTPAAFILQICVRQGEAAGMHIPFDLRRAQMFCAFTLFFAGASFIANAGETPPPKPAKYTGILTTIRKLTVAGTPDKVASVKTRGSLSAVATIPDGETRPVVEIVSGSPAIYGTDETFFTIDFTVEPPVMTIRSTGVEASFPTITVQGNTITAVLQVSINTPGITRARKATFKLTRVSP